MNRETQAADALPADGERFLPDRMFGDIELEHRHRYLVACELTVGQEVLDIACGEGYGSAMLAARARRVTGVDISPAAVEHARRQYPRDNLRFAAGSCAAIPLPDRSVDVVVSFETIEHHAEHERMLREIRRVLRPEGLLLISSPDKAEYSDRPRYRNPFHVKELYQEEFRALLAAHFRHVRLLGQRVTRVSLLVEERDAGPMLRQSRPATPSAPEGLRPLYWIALASDLEPPSVGGSLYESGATPPGAPARNSNIAKLISAVASGGSAVLRSSLQSDWYREQNPDLIAAGVDPYEHWLSLGADEGRLPCADPLSLLDRLMEERMTQQPQTAAGTAERHG
jgi:ubiquinone/menaquinone biosynthesis C-methylase UbiE